MPATQTEKLHGLDHLRALAIIFVFFFHYRGRIFGHPQWVSDVAAFGWTGVDLFFVLSGFLISSQLFAQIKTSGTFSLRSFFVKRVFRILPVYVLIVAIYFLIPAFREREALPEWWRFATFTQNLGLDVAVHGTFSHAWSLCVEEHFYLLLPVILLLLLRSRWFSYSLVLLIALFVFGLAIRIYCWDTFYEPVISDENSWMPWFKHIYYPTYCRLDGLLAGVSLAALCHFRPVLWSRLSRYGNLLIACSIVVLAGAYFLVQDPLSFAASIFGFPLVALGYGLMVAGAVSPGSFLYKWNSKIGAFIAAISYSVYLSHKGVIHLTQKAGETLHIDINSNTMLLICIATCVLAAFLLRLVVEKPFMKLGRNLLSKD